MKVFIAVPFFRQNVNKQAKIKGDKKLTRKTGVHKLLKQRIDELYFPDRKPKIVIINLYSIHHTNYILNASTPPWKSKIILLSPEWAYHIYFFEKATFQGECVFYSVVRVHNLRKVAVSCAKK